MTRNCLRCGKEFTPRAEHLRRGFGFYCSRDCHYAHKRALPPKPWEPRFWSYVDKDGPLWNGTPCWVWKASQDGNGYGRFNVPRKGPTQAYVVAYELLHGPTAEGMHHDHLCRNRICVNPEHLEVVTPAVNLKRGEGFARTNAEKTHCIRGHEFTPGNTYYQKGWRECRECRRIHAQEFKQNNPDYQRNWRRVRKSA